MGQPTSTGGDERWNVNMPAVIGVVFVFLVAVIVWVIVSSTGDDEAVDEPTPSTPPTVGPTAAPTTADVPQTTSQAPMPDPSEVTTAAPTTAPPATTQPPVTTAEGAEDGAVPGDLGIAGHPMQQPPCDDAYITILASAVGDQATADGIAAVLDQYPGSSYLRTDQSCPSLTPDIDGEPIYVVFLGPFAFDTDACAARSEGPDDAYARLLSDDVGPDHSVDCP